MSNRLTKTEWQQKIIEYYAVSEKPLIIQKTELPCWWYHHSTQTDSMRLDAVGFHRFKLAGVVFHKYECKVPTWTGALTIGLSHLQCPYYIESNKTTPGEYNFYLTDEEYAMLLMFASNDLVTFAKGISKNEIV
jgi:hypothetical protein